MACHLDVIDLVVLMVVWGLTGGSRFARMAHLSDDKTVAKMGHPVLRLVRDMPPALFAPEPAHPP